MRTFIAGATTTGPSCASAASVRRSSASPWASRASELAVSGATTSMTSPVERISGPRTGSAPGNRENGSTAAFTLTCVGLGTPSSRSLSFCPAANRQAASTRLTPTALLAKGTVREARGFASRT